jgi:hypothetical protein
MQVKDCRKAAPKEEQVGRSCESTERETDGDGAPIFTPEFPKADPYLLERGALLGA